VSRKVLLDIVWNSPDFQYVYMLPPTHPTSPWRLDFFVNPPSNEWINLKATGAYTKEEILRHQTLIGILSEDAKRYPTDPGIRWKEMNVLWNRSSDMISNLRIKEKYIEAMYEIGLEQGVIYFETRKNIYEEIYVLDPSPQYNSTYGRHYLNPMGEEEVGHIVRLSRNFAKKHPEFVGHKRISSAQRRSSFKKFNFYMENVVRMHNLYPDHVIGFDAVGEEDAGYSKLHYISEWLKLFNSTTGKPRVPLYLHSAETNWPDDLMASDFPDDLVSSLTNTYESILLSSSRIGHGHGFIKHPYLLTILKERQIPIEICVVSNQLLGFTADIRNHPAQHFIRYGIPIVLGADDPGTFGYDNFTIDWYEAFMAWGLDLDGLKTIAVNSLVYSGLSEEDKTDAIELKWRPMWDRYIMHMYEAACARDYVAEAAREDRVPTVARILPLEGAKNETTKMHILGRNFESGICRDVACRFGDQLSRNAVYISNQHILCESPEFFDEQERTVEVFLALDGTNFISTRFNFTYKYDAITIPTTPPTADFDNKPASLSAGHKLLVHERLIILFHIVYIFTKMSF